MQPFNLMRCTYDGEVKKKGLDGLLNMERETALLLEKNYVSTSQCNVSICEGNNKHRSSCCSQYKAICLTDRAN